MMRGVSGMTGMAAMAAGTVGLVAGLAWTMPAVAQGYPVKPVRLVHGFATGSAIDVFARPLAAKLSEQLPQQVVVDSRPGATGIIANELVARSSPDGHTLLAAPGSSLASTPHLQKVPFDPLRDFQPIVQLSSFSFVLVAHPAVPARSAADLIALARARPGYVTYGSTGIGSAFHLSGELFAMMAKVRLLHVPYRGGGSAAITDLVGGRVDLMWDSYGVVRPQMLAGRLKGIATTGPKRAAALPDLPTIAESGLPGYEMVGWHGVFAPAGTPREIVDRLNGLVTKILAAPDMRELWTTQGMEIVPSTPDGFMARLRSEYERYGNLIRTTGVRLQQ
jgi:tripartite-type tricarboxylate transporter receptor subunit TctC